MKKIDKEIAKSFYRLQSNPDGEVLMDWLKASLLEKYEQIGIIAEDSELRRHQGEIRNLKGVIDTIEGAKKFLDATDEKQKKFKAPVPRLP